MEIFSDSVFAMKNFFGVYFEGEYVVDDAKKESIFFVQRRKLYHTILYCNVLYTCRLIRDVG